MTNSYQGSNMQTNCPILYQEQLGISIFVSASPTCCKALQVIGMRWILQLHYVIGKVLTMKMYMLLFLMMKHFCLFTKSFFTVVAPKGLEQVGSDFKNNGKEGFELMASM